jgi:hypothetical protein
MPTNTTPYLGPLLCEPARLGREAARRKKPFDQKAITLDEIDEYVAEGWQIYEQGKRTTKVRREKVIDERLENRFWMLLFKMGYPEMNEGRKFTALIERKGAEPLTKQIDVFAKDDLV